MDQTIANIEYTLQYYGFSSESFFKDFCEIVLNEMAELMQDSLRELPTLPCELEDKEKLLEYFRRLHSIWSQRAEVILEKLKPTITELLTIPKNVLLPVDAVHAKQFSAEEVTKLEDEVKVLEEKYAKDIEAVNLYKAEIAALEKLEPVQKKVDEAIIAINKFEGTLKEIKELEEIALMHKEYKKNNIEDDDSEESNDALMHAWNFKAC